MQSDVNVSNQIPPATAIETPNEIYDSKCNQKFLTSVEQYKQTLKINQNIKKDLIMFVETRASIGQLDRESDESFELALHIHKTFLDRNSEIKVAFLIGDAGSGKSLFCKYLQRAIFFDWEVQGDESPRWLPIYINLSNFESFNMMEIISQTLSAELNLTQNEIALFQNVTADEKIQFLFIFDGLEKGQKARRWSSDSKSHKTILMAVNQSENYWKNSKYIITSQDKISSDIIDEEGLLTFNDKVSRRTFIEYNLQGFSDLEITAYLRKYAVLGDIYNFEELVQTFSPTPLEDLSWSLVKDYEDIIDCFDLRELLRIPLLLRMASEVLPDLIDYNKQISIWDIYESFINKQVEATVLKYLAGKSLNLMSIEDKGKVSLMRFIQQGLEQTAIILSKYRYIASKEERREDKEVLDELLHFCPVIQWDHSYRVSCIHRSIQEFLIAKKN